MVPCCPKCGKEHRALKEKNIVIKWIQQCRCKFVKTPKVGKNLLNSNQKRNFKMKKYRYPMAYHERPKFAQLQ